MEMREHIWAETMGAGRRGDAATHEGLLADIEQVLRRLIRRGLTQLGLVAYETEDLVQEFLIGLHTKRHTWDEGRPFLPWLRAIARYRLADAARRLRREARFRWDVTPDQWSTLFAAPAEDFDRILVDLDRHVNGLPGGQRDVVRATALERVSVRATAQKLRTSERAVCETLHRTLQCLAAAAHLERAKLIGGKT